MWLLGKCEDLLSEYFPGVERSSLLDIERNASLALTFGHPLLANNLRSVTHNYVMVGMMNCREPQPLPSHIESFIADAEEGVIFVSFG